MHLSPLIALAGLVVDPMKTDPRKVLAEIMVDTSAPAAARVTAAKALLADRAGGEGKGLYNAETLNRRALALLSRVAN